MAEANGEIADRSLAETRNVYRNPYVFPLGRPRGRRVLSRFNLHVVRWTQASLPNGLPRWTH